VSVKRSGELSSTCSPIMTLGGQDQPRRAGRHLNRAEELRHAWGDYVEMVKCLSTMPQNFVTLSNLLWSWVSRISRGELVDTGRQPRNQGTPGNFRAQEAPSEPSRAVPPLLQDRAYGSYTHNQSTVNAPTTGHNIHQGFVFNTRSRRDSDKG